MPGLPNGGMSAREIIDMLALAPHPEGGYFRETFRDSEPAGQRSASTAIYFLLPEGVVSRWHRVDAVEVWHWYAGAPLELRMSDGSTGRAVLLGNDLGRGQRPQAVVPRGHWQQAVTLGAWTLVGCTVAPGFEFAGFEIAPEWFGPDT